MATNAPSEVENTLQRLAHHRGVRGVIIMSNDTGRVIKHTGSMLEGSPGAADEANTSQHIRQPSSDTSENAEKPSLSSNGDTAPLVNATVRKYADAVRKIVEASKQAVQGLDDKVMLSSLCPSAALV